MKNVIAEWNARVLDDFEGCFVKPLKNVKKYAALKRN
jgi:hypothetical protein